MHGDTPPLILVTNDDGIHWQGITALSEALSDLGEVVTIAPDRNQSAVSHKITLNQPLRVTRLADDKMTLDGTPVDCVYLGVHQILDRTPQLVVSGINAGPNLGWDVHYSGTAAGAIEGTMNGISSFAVSLLERHGDYAHAARFARDLATWILERGGLPTGVTLNVNVPPGSPSKVRLTTLGRRLYSHGVHEREDPRGGVYYWIGGAPAGEVEADDTDCEAVRHGAIAVTPLMADLTDYPSLRGPLDDFGLSEWQVERTSRSTEDGP